jgi:hypothetical protein
MVLQLTPRSDQLNRLSTHHAAQLLTKEWMQTVTAYHEIFPVTISEMKNGAHGVTRPTVTAYAVRRPDKQWALLAINKDPKRAAQLNVQFKISDTQQLLNFVGKVETIQFSRAQYVWRDDGLNGHPIRSLPPVQFTREALPPYELPPYSLTILRGKLPD